MKKFAIFLVVVVGIAAAGFFWLSGNIDRIIKGVVEESGSEATKTNVTLASVDLDVRSGKISMNGLNVENPSGYEAENAFSFGAISIKVDTSTLRDDVIVVEEVIIDNPQVSYERKDGTSNIDQIKANVGGGSSSSATDEAGPKFIIKKLSFLEGHVSVTGVREETVELDLPPINLRNIGTAEGGATPTQIGLQVTQALSSAVVEAVAKEGLNRAVGDRIEGVKDKVKGLFGD